MQYVMCAFGRARYDEITGYFPQSGGTAVNRIDREGLIVAFEKYFTRAEYFQGFGVVFCSETQQQSLPAQLFGLLGFPSESMNNPQLGRACFTACGNEGIEGFDTMYDKRFFQFFGKEDVFFEDFELSGHRYVPGCVETAFADGDDVFESGGFGYCSPCFFGNNGAFIRVYAYRETAVGTFVHNL